MDEIEVLPTWYAIITAINRTIIYVSLLKISKKEIKSIDTFEFQGHQKHIF